MKLDKILNFKKVRCVKGYDGCLKVGKEYGVIDVRMEVKVKDDEGDNYYWESDHFEPVLADNCQVNIQDIGTNILDTDADIKDTPKFKVGDPVYFDLSGRIAVIEKLDGSNDFCINNSGISEGLMKSVCLATPENYERLQATFPHIEFERPLTQADIDNEAVDKLAQAMKNKLAKKREKGYHGWETCKHGDLVQLLINHVDKGDPIDVANFCAFLFARGEPLTEVVLDE